MFDRCSAMLSFKPTEPASIRRPAVRSNVGASSVDVPIRAERMPVIYVILNGWITCVDAWRSGSQAIIESEPGFERKKGVFIDIAGAGPTTLDVGVHDSRFTAVNVYLLRRIVPQNAVRDGWGRVVAINPATSPSSRIPRYRAVRDGRGGVVATTDPAAVTIRAGSRIPRYRAVRDGRR